MRCGRCSGVFNLDTLYELSIPSSTSSNATPNANSNSNSNSNLNQLELFKEQFKKIIPYIILPSKELLEPQSHDEWYCPLCLQEDTHIHSHRSLLFFCIYVDLEFFFFVF